MVRQETRATRAAPAAALVAVTADAASVGADETAAVAEMAPYAGNIADSIADDIAASGATVAPPMAVDVRAGDEPPTHIGEREAGAELAGRPVEDADILGGVGAGPTVARIGYAPIVRVDAERREIELCATSEAVDSHGTVFDYAASKAAFLRWLGNVREMHERRAVGTRVAVRCDDAARKIFVRLRISRGAQDTWEKVLDGTLRGASIGATGVVWRRQQRRVAGRERTLDVATQYDLAELSLVDNPSNPDALGVTFVRDAAPDLALLDALEPHPMTPTPILHSEREGESHLASATIHAGNIAAQTPHIPETPTASAHNTQRTLVKQSAQRAQGPFSPNVEGYPDAGVPEAAEARPTAALDLPGLAAPSDGADNARERFHDATRALLLGCGCLLCQAALAALGAHASDTVNADAAAARSVTGGATRLAEAALTRMVTAGLHASADRLAAVDVALREMVGATQAIAQRLTATQGEATGALGDLRGRVAALEAQPTPGGPAARPAEKSHPLAAQATRGTSGAYGVYSAGGLGSASVSASGWPGEPVNAEEQCRALESLAGRLRDPQAQIAVAAELIRLRQG
ncbi:MAG TPA: hypothetical protein VMV29_22975 [Ktedonobacterales bacterium]|nr:hypothetical protein [Ktedonobacterales bacterium]